MSIHPLSRVCCQRDPDPKLQRAQIEQLLDTGANIHETDKKTAADYVRDAEILRLLRGK